MARLRTLFVNNKGFSLMELVVAAGISVIVGGVAVFVLVMAVETYTRMVRQYEAESEMAMAMLAVSATLSNSQKILLQSTVGGSVGGIPNDEKNNRNAVGSTGVQDASYITRGYLMASFDNTGVTGNTHLVSMGITETGSRSVRSNLTAFGLFYQQPTEDFSGAIYIDKERNAGGWTEVSPINANQTFGRFTHFGVTDIRVRTANNVPAGANEGAIVAVNNVAAASTHTNLPVLSANFVFQMRYFTKGRKQDFFWCPPANMTAACTARSNLVHYLDITKNLKVVFANQEMVDYYRNNTTYLPNRMYGKIYFFKFLPSIK